MSPLKLNTKIKKDSETLENLIKSGPVDIVSKFTFPYMPIEKEKNESIEKNDKNDKNSSDENGDQFKITKSIVKLKPKNIESIQVRLQEKIKKIMKSNYSSHKSKEIYSRSKHEHCCDSPFNQLIRNFNEFIILTSDKIESREDVGLIMESCKRLNYKPIKTLFLPYYSSAEFIEEVKQKVLETFLSIINSQNEMIAGNEVTGEEQDQFTRSNGYKAFIEKGNNGTAVKTILNRRSWWSIQESHDENYESSDLVWTQWLKQKIIDNIPTSQVKLPFNSIYNKIEANFNLSDK